MEEFEVDRVVGAERWEPDYNVAPTKPVPAVLVRRSRGGADRRTGTNPDSVSGSSGALGTERQLRVLRWGLVPSWAGDPSIGSRMINARVETVTAKPAFRSAVARRRCLLPADGYYEWYATHAPSGRGGKQPFFIRPATQGLLAMAGIYELWRDPGREADDPESRLWTCAVLTTAATDEVGVIHDRMPLVVHPSRWTAWLDPTRSDPRALTGLLEPAFSVRLEAYPVSTAVGSVHNNGPHLVEPVPADVSGPPRPPAPDEVGAGPAELRLF